MKYLIILADGMADHKIPELGNRTPIQAANTPNIDFLANRSIIGNVATIPEGFPPGSDVANLSVLGYDPSLYYNGRSPLEAASMGIELGESDLSLRCNLVTLSEAPNYTEKIMLDYSAGEIESGIAAQLIQELEKRLGDDTFSFHPGISYRHLVVWRNGLGNEVKLTPPHDISDQVIGPYLPQGQNSDKLTRLMIESEKLLAGHPINLSRKKNSLKPANSIWLWGEGKKPKLPSFKTKYGLRGSVVAAVDLVKGLGVCAGLSPVAVKGATGSIQTDFSAKARAAIEELKSGQDFVYLHIESPDESSHQGSLTDKIWSIEQIDEKVVGLVIESLQAFPDIRIMLLPDHATPLATRTHSRDPVPFMIFDKNHPVVGGVGKYNEFSALNGVTIRSGHQLMDYFIGQ
jgi:2,3-bisphosphoglycerate-independent phosphoglycerate mutase